MKTVITASAIALLFAPAPVRAQAINDAQIASIVVTANQVDIDAGKLAQTMASDADVKKFGQLMIDDHTGVNKSATELATKLKVTPEDNPTSQSLKSEGDKNLAHLKTPQRGGVRQGIHRSRSRLSPAGDRRPRQDADPRRHERGAQGAARQGEAGIRGTPRACQAAAVHRRSRHGACALSSAA